MRFTIASKRYVRPYTARVILGDGRRVNLEQSRLGRHIKVGDTGKMVQGRTRPHWKLDAIDIEYDTNR